MCDNHEADEAVAKALLGMTPSAGITRRHLFGLLGGVAALRTGALVVGRSGASAAGASVNGLTPVNLGMHVHGPWSEHLNLWHTFTRNGVFLTGSGANDAHNSGAWKGLGNGFITGVFPTSDRIRPWPWSANGPARRWAPAAAAQSLPTSHRPRRRSSAPKSSTPAAHRSQPVTRRSFSRPSRRAASPQTVG
jgi:hypothetical protein